MIHYKQFAPNGVDVDIIVNQVTDHIHSILADDDDPSNDDSQVSIYMTPGDNGRTLGTWVYGEAEGDISPYPRPERADWEIDGAEQAAE